MKILAKAASYSDDGYCTTLGFADDLNKPERFVILSMTDDPDEQDVELGQDGVHIVVGGVQVDGYGLVAEVQATGSGLVVSLVPAVFERVAVGRIEVELENLIIDGVPIGEAIAGFRNRLASTKPM